MDIVIIRADDNAFDDEELTAGGAYATEQDFYDDVEDERAAKMFRTGNPN